MVAQSFIIPIREAQEIIRELCISRPSQIDIEAIAIELSVFPQEAPLEGCDARLLLDIKQGTGIATVNSLIPEIGRKRFSLAHEIGHFKLHSKHRSAWKCTGLDFLKWYVSDDEEPEANTFAAEILMPEEIFRKHCVGMKPSFSSISDLAGQFNTSLTATTIRYVSIGNYPCALIASREGKITWFRHSNDFYYHIRPVGSKIDPCSCAADFFLKDKTPPNHPEPVNPLCWLKDTNGIYRIKIFEQAVAMHQYGTVLSLIWGE